MNTQTVVNISIELQETKNDLSLHDINTIAVIANNAGARQMAITEFVDRNPSSFAGLRCGAHVINLVIRKRIESFEPLQNANTKLLKAVKEKVVPRFSDIRWNSWVDIEGPHPSIRKSE